MQSIAEAKRLILCWNLITSSEQALQKRKDAITLPLTSSSSVAPTNDIKIDQMWFTCKCYYCKISTGQVDTVSSPRSHSNANMRLEKM